MFNKTFLKSRLKKFLKSTPVIRCLSLFIFLYLELAGRTTRWQFRNINEITTKLKNDNAIWISWHARATMMPFFWRRFFNRKMAALVSPHQDGQIIAHLLRWFRIMPVNGSTNENARQSALELMRAVLKGNDLFISPDGPRGPRMRMKKSPIYYAQKTGKPIVCACFSLNRALVFGSAWDRTMVSLPFGKGIFALSEPLYIPAELSDDEFENYRQKLEDIANNLSIECDKAVGREPILPADINEIKQKKDN